MISLQDLPSTPIPSHAYSTLYGRPHHHSLSPSLHGAIPWETSSPSSARSEPISFTASFSMPPFQPHLLSPAMRSQGSSPYSNQSGDAHSARNFYASTPYIFSVSAADYPPTSTLPNIVPASFQWTVPAEELLSQAPLSNTEATAVMFDQISTGTTCIPFSPHALPPDAWN